MTVYFFDGKEYGNLYELRYKNPQLVFPNDAPASLLSKMGITSQERPDPVPAEPTAEEILQQKKIERNQAVNAIKVTVDGMEFDGNEDAQRRMNNAISAAKFNNSQTLEWVLADNTLATVTPAQLEQAHALAVQQMSEIWTALYK